MTKAFIALILLICLTQSYAQSSVLRPKIQNLVDRLNQDNTVHFGYHVGYPGAPETKNKYYKTYIKLKKQASNDELVLLTKQGSACIVVYSFSILQSRNYNSLKEIFYQHSNDTTFFWTASGCTGVIDRVNWFMLKTLRPVPGDLTGNFLTQNEYDKYCSLFTKEDKLFSCN